LIEAPNWGCRTTDRKGSKGQPIEARQDLGPLARCMRNTPESNRIRRIS
jgi:hypothetical protein